MRTKHLVIMTAAVAVTSYTASTIINKKKALKIDQEIIAKAERDILNILKASAIVMDKIRNGDYVETGIPQIEKDLTFYQMIYDE